MGPRGICTVCRSSVSWSSLFGFFAATNHTIKMCIYSSAHYIFDFNLSITSQTALSLQTAVSIKFKSDTLQSLEIALFVET